MKPRDRRFDVRAHQAQPVPVMSGYRMRMVVTAAAMACVFVFMQVQMVLLGLQPTEEPTADAQAKLVEAPRRGDIYDRNGLLLATTLKVYSLYADPKAVMDVDEVIKKLTRVLPDLDASTIKARLNRKGRFVWLKRHITPKQVYAINALGLPGLGFREENTRVYPIGRLAAHIVGGVNTDGVGVAGVERGFNARLSKGEPIRLTVDLRLQQLLVESLMHAISTDQAKAAWGVVIDPTNGDMLALASLPDYDPNQFGDAHPEQWRNRVTDGVYEMGSIFKVFTLAQALEELKLPLEYGFDCTRPLQVGKYAIGDFHAKNAWLTTREVFRYSSNIGSARIADMFAEGAQREFLDKIHLLDGLNFGFGEPPNPMAPPPNRWKRIQSMTISFGHGISITPVQMAAAVGAFVSDGYWRRPHILQDDVREAPQQVVSARTVAKMRDLMRDVVREGTGKNAAVFGLDIGGKTGTAEKIENGRYLDGRNLASFVGAVPLDNPRLVALIMVDEGLGGSGTGGSVAAPAFSRFVAQAAPLMGIMPITSEQLVAQAYDVKKVNYEAFGTPRGQPRLP